MEKRVSTKTFIILLLVALLFGILSRMYWVYWANGIDDFKFNGEFIIQTFDGFTFAEGARDLLQGYHQPNDLSKVQDSLAKFTYILNKILPFSFESIIFYMSIFFSSLIAIPIMLISRDLYLEKAGFIASLLATIANSYYYRTMAGRYDTDMLIIVLTLFVLYSIVHVSIKNDFKSLIFIPICVWAMKWWYIQSYSLLVAFGIMLLLYTLIFDRKNPIKYQAISIFFISIANFMLIPKILIIGIIFILAYKFEDKFNIKNSIVLVILSIIVLLFSGGIDPIMHHLKNYVLKKDSYTESLQFFDVSKTIIEAKIIDIDKLALRISGHMIVFIISTLGYLLLLWKRRVMLLSLPMVGFGFLSLVAGLRFTIYGVPVLAFGFGFFCVILVDWIFKNRQTPILIQNIIITLLTLIALYPMGKNIYNYKAPTALFNSEATILDNLKSIANREDYVISWWDFGYYIRYYSDVKTLIDGGKHTGQDNFAVSFILTKDPISSYNMSKLAVKYTEKSYKEGYKSIFSKILSDYNQTNINTFLDSLKDEKFKIDLKSTDIYLYFPKRMIKYLSTIQKFSRLDLKTGKAYREPLFIVAKPLSLRKNGYIDVGNKILIHNNGRDIYFGNIKHTVNIIATIKDQKTILVKGDINSNIYLIFSKDHNEFIIVDKEMFNSTLIQMGLLGIYNDKLYNKITDTKDAKIYRLR